MESATPHWCATPPPWKVPPPLTCPPPTRCGVWRWLAAAKYIGLWGQISSLFNSLVRIHPTCNSPNLWDVLNVFILFSKTKQGFLSKNWIIVLFLRINLLLILLRYVFEKHRCKMSTGMKKRCKIIRLKMSCQTPISKHTKCHFDPFSINPKKTVKYANISSKLYFYQNHKLNGKGLANLMLFTKAGTKKDGCSEAHFLVHLGRPTGKQWKLTWKLFN